VRVLREEEEEIKQRDQRGFFVGGDPYQGM